MLFCASRFAATEDINGDLWGLSVKTIQRLKKTTLQLRKTDTAGKKKPSQPLQKTDTAAKKNDTPPLNKTDTAAKTSDTAVKQPNTAATNNDRTVYSNRYSSEKKQYCS